MTEKEKMLKSLLYDASDQELAKERSRARELIYRFNHSKPAQVAKRMSILKKLFGKIGGSYSIDPPFYCDYGYNIEVGENFYANFNCCFLDVNKISIGNNTLIGPNVQIYTAGHPTDPEKRLTMLEFGKPIKIGSNVWIGGSSIICPGVTIGDNVTIGAGSVVTKDIPSNVIVAGNPTKIIKVFF